jgi:hypothetical protein
MLKRLVVLFMVLCLVPSMAYATMVDTRVSANTTTFNTVNFTVNRGANIVSFNTTTNFISMMNLSKSVDCYADIRCVDANGIPGHAAENTLNVLLPAIGSATPNVVNLNFATRNIAFGADASYGTTAIAGQGNNLKVYYVVTGDNGTF